MAEASGVESPAFPEGFFDAPAGRPAFPAAERGAGGSSTAAPPPERGGGGLPRLGRVLTALGLLGAGLSFAGPVAAGDRLELTLPGSGFALPLEVVLAQGGEVSGRFLADRATRWELIALLYTGAFANEVASVAPMRTLGHAMRRTLG